MSLRVLHCPDVVGGNSAGLAAAERELGLHSTTVVLRPSPYGYAVDEVVWDDDDGVVVRELKRWRLLVRALRDFDVVHFNFGSTIAPQRVVRDALGPGRRASPRLRAWAVYAALAEQIDLPLLRRAGKAVFVTFQGDDARQGDASDFGESSSAEVPAGYYSAESDRNKRRRIARFAASVDGIYALNPDLLHVLPAGTRFVPYANVDIRTRERSAPAGTGTPPLVLHLPTSREVKGTRFLLEAVSRLHAEGVELDFQLVEGVTHDEVERLYRSADLVVDQLLVGWYGGVAVEAMALERPVISYLREEDLALLPSDMRAEIPVISAEPATITDVMRELLTTRRGELAEIGRRGGEYVRRWHDPLRIAQELVTDYEAAVTARRG